MSRGTKALVSKSALLHNFQRVRELAPNSSIWAVVKADAYGHGSVEVANVLSEADGYAVATLAEAITLRESGINARILLLEGFTKEFHIQQVEGYSFDCVIHSFEHLDQMQRYSFTKPVNVWLKVDTGMHRLGFFPEELDDARARVASNSSLNLCGVMTHMCSADDLSDNATSEQLCLLNECAKTGENRSAANSAAILCWPETHMDWVRPGIMLYGASPFADKSVKELGLAPVMTLLSPIIAIRIVKKGESTGYGKRWVAQRDSKIATLAIGYADGYPRHAPDGTPIWINGKVAPLAGRVSMDMIMVDVTDLPEVKIGDLAELWGNNIPVDEIANYVGTIGYELVTRLSPRVDREMIE